MLFIAILIVAATAIAGSAAFFSVYGLAYTFSGTFWSVVVMGASLELGKLVTASYLYRYWDKTNLALKSYLMMGVFALMVLTSTGIFGYLSTGYQTDVLPLKQAQEQVQMLDEEKVRLLDRKKQIDTQISQLPTNSVKGRTQLIKGFKDEQASVTARISELDKETLIVKQKLIQTEAHIGPITYIAKAFGLDSDNATKYLIYLIIFAFDPMAVALTLAVNIAQRLRKEELEDEAKAVLQAARDVEDAEREERKRKLQAEHEERMFAESLAAQIVEHSQPHVSNEVTPIDDAGAVFIPHEDEVIQPFIQTLQDDVVQPEPEMIEADNVDGHTDSMSVEPEVIPPFVATELDAGVEVVSPQDDPQLDLDFNAPLPEPAVEVQPEPEPFVQAEDPHVGPPVTDLPPPKVRPPRPYASLWNAADTDSRINELVSELQWLRGRRESGETLSADEHWELLAIEDILSKRGYNKYL